MFKQIEVSFFMVMSEKQVEGSKAEIRQATEKKKQILRNKKKH